MNRWANSHLSVSPLSRQSFPPPSLTPFFSPLLTAIQHRRSRGVHFDGNSNRRREGGSEGRKGCEGDGHRELERISAAQLDGKNQFVGDLRRKGGREGGRKVKGDSRNSE